MSSFWVLIRERAENGVKSVGNDTLEVSRGTNLVRSRTNGIVFHQFLLLLLLFLLLRRRLCFHVHGSFLSGSFLHQQAIVNIHLRYYVIIVLPFSPSIRFSTAAAAVEIIPL